MRSILSRKLTIVGCLVGVLVVSSAIGAVANSSHHPAQVRFESASSPDAQQSPRLESPMTNDGDLEHQNAQAPEPTPEAQPTEAAEDEANENDAAENDNDEHPSPTPSSTPATSNRTFSLIGGTVMVTCTGSSISLDSATPNSGFVVDSERNDSGRVEVRFRDDNHDSRLELTCQNGSVMVQELREEQD